MTEATLHPYYRRMERRRHCEKCEVFALRVWMGLLLVLLTGGRILAADADITPRACLVLGSVGRGGMSPIRTDAIEKMLVTGTWQRPNAGDMVTLSGGKTQTWTALDADKDGVFRSRCVDWFPLFDFFGRHQLPADASVRQIDFVTPDPGVSSRFHWAEIRSQTRRLLPSSVHLRFDPGKARVVGTTENVARLAMDIQNPPPGPLPVREGEIRARPTAASPIPPGNARSPARSQIQSPPPAPGGGRGVGSPLTVALDGQTLAVTPTGKRISLARGTDGKWAASSELAPTMQSPTRCGPFKAAFNHRMQFVYGTRGTTEENAWALAKARFDAEQFWYRGNGAVDIVADTEFDAKRERDRSVILLARRFDGVSHRSPGV